MNPLKFESAGHVRKYVVPVISIVTIAAMIACSSESKPLTQSTSPVAPSSQQASIKTAATVATHTEIKRVSESASVKRPQSRLLTYKSRDYGVSFEYPWQYAKIGPRAISQGDVSLQPRADGTETQFPLVRIHVPKSFYPDTNLDSSYFAMSLNSSLDEKGCEASLGAKKPELIQTTSINGLDYKWVETDTVGGGSSEKLRNYVAFANGTCYEMELGVKTANEQGLAREVDPDQVMRRLNAILQTVKVESGEIQTAAADTESQPDVRN